MRGIDHLVLAGRDLEAMRTHYAGLGFTLTPPARHPFGTANSLVQFDRCFLELLTVADPTAIPEPTAGRFSFAAFNRDFLNAGRGLLDARAGLDRMRAATSRRSKPRGSRPMNPSTFRARLNFPPARR